MDKSHREEGEGEKKPKNEQFQIGFRAVARKPKKKPKMKRTLNWRRENRWNRMQQQKWPAKITEKTNNTRERNNEEDRLPTKKGDALVDMVPRKKTKTVSGFWDEAVEKRVAESEQGRIDGGKKMQNNHRERDRREEQHGLKYGTRRPRRPKQ